MVELHVAPEFQKKPKPDPTEQLEWLLKGWAAGFAWLCRQEPDLVNYRDTDPERRSDLTIGKGGLQEDESEAFLRAYREGLVVVGPDGSFSVAEKHGGGGLCHLIRRNGDAVALHADHLIQIGAYAEFVLDKGWYSHQLEFRPVGAAFDVRGRATVERHGARRVVVLVAATARIDGSDSPSSLRGDLLAKGGNNATRIANDDHRRKWDALVEHTGAGPVLVWLVASGARRTLAAFRSDGVVRVRDLNHPMPRFEDLASVLKVCAQP